MPIDPAPFDKMAKSLANIDAEIPKKLKQIGKEAAEIVADEARGIVPVRSGALRNKIKSGATAKGGDVRVGGLPYVGPIHFGWAKHSIAPNPFLFRASDTRRDEVIDKYNDDVAKLIDTTISGG